MLNAKRIFFIGLGNIGVRLFRRGIYSTSNSQRASAARGFERAHAQKHPTTNGHGSTLIKRERTTDLKLAHFPRELAATLAALPSTSLIPSAPFTDPTDWGAHAPRVLVSAPSLKQSSISPRSTRSSRRYFESGKQEARKWDFPKLKVTADYTDTTNIVGRLIRSHQRAHPSGFPSNLARPRCELCVRRWGSNDGLHG